MNAGDIDTLKQELLTEMRREIQQAKQEIIDGKAHLSLKPLEAYV